MRHIVLSFLMVEEVENSLGLICNQEMLTIHRDHMEITRPLHAMSQVSSVQAFPAISSFAFLNFYHYLNMNCQLRFYVAHFFQVTPVGGVFHASKCSRVYLSTPVVQLLLSHIVLSFVIV